MICLGGFSYRSLDPNSAKQGQSPWWISGVHAQALWSVRYKWVGTSSTQINSSRFNVPICLTRLLHSYNLNILTLQKSTYSTFSCDRFMPFFFVISGHLIISSIFPHPLTDGIRVDLHFLSDTRGGLSAFQNVVHCSLANFWVMFTVVAWHWFSFCTHTTLTL